MANTSHVHLSEATIFWTPEGGVEHELDVREFSANPKVELADRSGSKGGRSRRRIAGMADGSGTAQVYFRKDAGENAYSDLDMVPGREGTFRCPAHEGGPDYTLPVILGEEFSDTIYSNEDVHVIEIPFQRNGDWLFGGQPLDAVIVLPPPPPEAARAAVAADGGEMPGPYDTETN